MLIDVNTRPARAEMAAILGILSGGLATLERVSKGVYLCGHWNADSMISEKVTNQYPHFSRQNIEWIERLLQKNPDDRYLREEMEASKRVPEQDLHRYENWKQNEQGEHDDNQIPGENRQLSAYGVCDSPEQLLSLYDFEADPRPFFIAMVKLSRGDQPRDGGWRWHKWGPYVGKQNPQCEYLHDEPAIEEIYTFHIYELADEKRAAA
jgi:serine/threonine protein kinase